MYNYIRKLFKARKRPLALLVAAAVLVSAAHLALMAGHRFGETAHGARTAVALRPFDPSASSTAAADHPFSIEATAIPQATGWIDILPRWSAFTLPYGDEKGGPTRLGEYVSGLPTR